jgi:hypothetical protein
MGFIALSITVLGFVLMTVGGIWFLVSAFRVGPMWGIAVLFIPFANFFFLIQHWYDAKRPFLYHFLGFLIMIVGVSMLFNASHQFASQHMTAIEDEIKRQLAQLEQAQQGTAVFPGDETGPAPAAAQERYTGDIKDLMLVGRTLQEVRELLGPPKAVLTTEEGVTYFNYPGLELMAQDGVTVSSQALPVDTE